MDKVAFYEQKGPIMLIVSIREKVRWQGFCFSYI